MKSYLDMLEEVYRAGSRKGDRTGTGTFSIFGEQWKHDLSNGFPLLTTKKIHFKSVVHELLWLISGSTNIKYLQDNGVRIWNEWADDKGELGPVYGQQWRAWPHPGTVVQKGDDWLTQTTDQLAEVIERIKTNPNCRRLMVNAWNVAEIPNMKLPPCHVLYQFNVTGGRLNCHMYQRSADIFLGVPFNLASYALLTHMVAQVCDLQAGQLIVSYGDLHLYHNHCLQTAEQITRSPYTLPQIRLNPRIKDIDEFTYDDIELLYYNAHPPIKAQVSV